MSFHRFPSGLVNFMSAMFLDLMAYVRVQRSLHVLGLIFTCILQGCPFASLLFDVSVEPF